MKGLNIVILQLAGVGLEIRLFGWKRWNLSSVAQEWGYAGRTEIWAHNAGDMSSSAKIVTSWQMVVCFQFLWDLCKLGVSVWVRGDFYTVHVTIIKIGRGNCKIFLPPDPSWQFFSPMIKWCRRKRGLTYFSPLSTSHPAWYRLIIKDTSSSIGAYLCAICWSCRASEHFKMVFMCWTDASPTEDTESNRSLSISHHL